MRKHGIVPVEEIGIRPDEAGFNEFVITVELKTEHVGDRWITRLNADCRSFAGVGLDVDYDIDIIEQGTVSGRLSRNSRVIYAAGDSIPDVGQEMSLLQFAKVNGGNYVVVTARLD